MIVPMKRLSIIMQSKDAKGAIDELGSLGILHIEHQNKPAGEGIEALREKAGLFDKAITILSMPELKEKGAGETPLSRDLEKMARHIVDSFNRFDRLQEYRRRLERAISEWEPWGEFDPDSIKNLSQKGIIIKLYRIPSRDIKKIPKEAIVEIVSRSGQEVLVAIISREHIAMPFKEAALPKQGLKDIRLRLREDEQIIESIKNELRGCAYYRTNLVNAKANIEKELEFERALSGMGKDNALMYVTGFVPVDMAQEVEKKARKEKWAISLADPSDEDTVPTLIRNPRWVSIVEPVFKLLEIVPGYKELDISMWFLLFFSVFFGMLIGDAGYGAIFFALTLFFHKKYGKNVEKKSVFTLFYILSSCAVLWGILTGTFFGQAWLPPSIKPILPALRDDKNIQTFCFFLGALQLSVAHLWRAERKAPSLSALSDGGWVLILWGVFFLAKTLILGDGFPAFGKWMFLAGVMLVILFTSPQKNIIKGIGAGFGSILLNFINSFTDVVSYIRLFAVGIATVAIADAFNKIAMDVGFNSLFSGALAAIILVLGHALNIILGPLSILVHGVRLNALEFCGHLNVTWSGIAYRPLKKENREAKPSGGDKI